MLKGAYTLLITPFKEDLSLDVEGLKMLVKKQIDSGIHGIAPLGVTGLKLFPMLALLVYGKQKKESKNLQILELIIFRYLRHILYFQNKKVLLIFMKNLLIFHQYRLFYIMHPNVLVLIYFLKQQEFWQNTQILLE